MKKHCILIMIISLGFVFGGMVSAQTMPPTDTAAIEDMDLCNLPAKLEQMAQNLAQENPTSDMLKQTAEELKQAAQMLKQMHAIMMGRHMKPMTAAKPEMGDCGPMMSGMKPMMPGQPKMDMDAMMGMMNPMMMPDPDPKTRGLMMQMRGEMMKAMGDIMLKYGKIISQEKPAKKSAPKPAPAKP